jgi:murein L,D-transpeptidase YafK
MKKWLVGIVATIVLAASGYYFFPEKTLPPDKKITKLIVLKSEHVLLAYSSDEIIKTYHVSIGRNSSGHKISRGDKRTPEGIYTIDQRNSQSGYHKNLGVSYPNDNDRQAAKKKNLDPGGDIKIHGMKNGWGFIGKFHKFVDWTAGCIAVTDDEMDELYERVEIGTPIIIKP